MSKIRVLIVDDEPLARQRIRDLLERDAEVAVAGECADGVEAVEAILASVPDVVFLDVRMPGMDGFEVVREVGVGRVPVVVFVTAYDRYALDAFAAHAMDYLLKPFEDERFEEMLRRAKALARRGAGDDLTRLAALLASASPAPERLERLLVRAGERFVLLRADEVEWIRAEGNYVRVRSRGSEYLMRESLAGLESRLDPSRFARVHRSAIVNLDCVREFQPLFHGDYRVVMRDGAELPVGRTFRDRILKSQP